MCVIIYIYIHIHIYIYIKNDQSVSEQCLYILYLTEIDLCCRLGGRIILLFFDCFRQLADSPGDLSSTSFEWVFKLKAHALNIT